MKIQVTNQNGQNVGNGNGNVRTQQIDFKREINKQYANELVIEKQQCGFVDEEAFKGEFAFRNVHECLAKAKMAFLQQGKKGAVGFNVAYACAYAKFAGINITEQVNLVYPARNSVMSFAS